MLRFLAGVASAMLLMTGGFFLWRGQAEQESIVPPAPEAREAPSPLLQPPLETPPAAPEKSREEKRFARYDKDEDGSITRAEMMESRRKAWEKLDTNGNGSLSFEEWAVATSTKFAEADRSRDGRLDAAEFLTTKRETKPRKKCAC